jgi:hypothetical protein
VVRLCDFKLVGVEVCQAFSVFLVLLLFGNSVTALFLAFQCSIICCHISLMTWEVHLTDSNFDNCLALSWLTICWNLPEIKPHMQLSHPISFCSSIARRRASLLSGVSGAVVCSVHAVKCVRNVSVR